ncbi:MAG: hydroxyacylglutathione hydrolase [Betaproteobacteria bacterium]|nr:hydroxyacylglutathione hydrolase [Betaproteobacteria bacterium]NDF74640.1 hydroxyacylglutathione hydrolase [Betaproteobacteria bacterium]
MTRHSTEALASANPPGQFVARLSPQLHRIKAFADNYLWMLQDPRSSHCWVVDPGDGQALIDAACARDLQIVGILLTHHHADHQGGVDDLHRWAANQGRVLEVFGPRDERIHRSAQPVEDGSEVDLGFGVARVIAVPGHTRSHIAYYLEQERLLFCGDCLFAAGCGRIFEGSPAQMLDSLEKLSALHPESLVCCAHEYTLANLRFASAAYPDHPQIAARLQEAIALRAQDLPTVPSLLRHELQSNPFLLGLVPQAQPAASAKPAQIDESHAARVDRFAALRAWKNEFRAV